MYDRALGSKIASLHPLGAAPSIPGGHISMPQASPISEQHMYEGKLHKFTHEAAKEFIAGKIGREDLQKAASHAGTEDYHVWKHGNLKRYKAVVKETTP